MADEDIDWEKYGVTPCGVVYSKEYVEVINNRWGTKTERKKVGKVLKPWLDGSKRYLQVGLGKGKKVSLHRMVALYYLPNPKNLPCVHHKNHNTMDNRVINLQWVTHSENMNYNAEVGSIKGFYGPQKLVPSQELDKTLLSMYQDLGSFSAMDGFLGASRSAISRYFKKRGLL